MNSSGYFNNFDTLHGSYHLLIEESKYFNKVYDLYKLENPNPEPSFNQFPTSVQLNS